MPDTPTPEDRPLTKADLREALDAAVHAIATDFSDLRAEMSRRIETLERRAELQTPILLSIQTSLAALARSVDALISDTSQQKGAFATID